MSGDDDKSTQNIPEAPLDSENANVPVTSIQTALMELMTHWPALSLSERREKFSQLPRTEAEELFLSLNTHDQAELIAEVGSLEKRSWIRLLAPDDVADLIQEIGVDSREEILGLVDPQTRREVSALLAYAEDKAGGLMSSRYARLRPEMTVDEAISYLRIQAKTQIETIYYAYVLDFNQVLLGVVSFRELFSTSPNKIVKDIMTTDVIKIPVNLDQEKIGHIFSSQNLMAIPVIDDMGKMQGIITFDDVATAIQEEATEDIQKIGGVETLDAPYMKIGIMELVKKRGVWLGALFIGEMATATAMGHYQSEIEKAVVLALFIPLIISSGGNSGSQASTLIIRAMALGEIRLRDWWRVFFREVICGTLLGLGLGLIGFLRVILWPAREELYGAHYFKIAFTVSASVLGVVLWGSLTGAMLPFLFKKFKLDPATASAPAVATIVDVTGLIIYFTLASLILTEML
jgi:magnesium transporter